MRLKVIHRGFIRDYLRPEPVVNYLGRAPAAPSRTMLRSTRIIAVLRAPKTWCHSPFAERPTELKWRRPFASRFNYAFESAAVPLRNNLPCAKHVQKSTVLLHTSEWIRQTAFFDAQDLREFEPAHVLSCLVKNSAMAKKREYTEAVIRVLKNGSRPEKCRLLGRCAHWAMSRSASKPAHAAVAVQLYGLTGVPAQGRISYANSYRIKCVRI